MSLIQLTLTRASLSLPDLVISSDPAGAFVLPEDGIGEPDITWRYTYAPPSGDLHGSILLAAVKEHSSLPLVINVHGSTAAELQTNKQALTDALEQWSYNAQLLVNGQGGTWSCDPTSPNWGDFDSGMARAFMARASIVIPVYPIPGA